MRKQSRGFTLVEVVLFLAITGALFIGIAGSVQNLLSQQRNNDAVQNFMEFLRRMYSEVDNVQNPDAGGGRSDYAIYGKMITFGEKYNLTGEENKEKEIFAYTVVGITAESGMGSVLEELAKKNANVLEKDGTTVRYAGLVEGYTTKWGSEIQPGCYEEESCFQPMRGTLLIVRHPASGNMYTYYSSEVVEVNQKVREGKVAIFGDKNLSTWGFEAQQIDFCVNVADDTTIESDARFDVRILENAHGASGVEYIPDNNAEGISGGPNKCTR